MSVNRLAAHLLASVCVLALAACGGGGGGGAPATNIVSGTGTGGTTSGTTGGTSSGGTSGGTTTGGSTTSSDSSSGSGTGGIVGNTTTGGNVTGTGNVTGVGDTGNTTSGNTSFSFMPPDPATIGANATSSPSSTIPVSSAAYPLEQTAITVAANGIGPDTATNAGGATLSIVNWNGGGDSQFRLTIPGLGIDQTFTSPNLFKSASSDLANNVQLITMATSYTELGAWEFNASLPTPVAHIGVFVTGFETPSTAIPVSGNATYSATGNVYGVVATHLSSGSVATATLSGDASFSANFASGAVTGNFTNITAKDGNGIFSPWNSVSVSAFIASGTSHFSGSTATTTPSSSTPYTVGGNATGHINGGFYGPHAEELGAVWSLASDPTAAIGWVRAPSDGSGSSGGGGGISVGTGDPGSGVGVGIGGSH